MAKELKEQLESSKLKVNDQKGTIKKITQNYEDVIREKAKIEKEQDDLRSQVQNLGKELENDKEQKDILNLELKQLEEDLRETKTQNHILNSHLEKIKSEYKTQGVNFINIIRMNFSYERRFL